jgi:hypothetical protein
MSSRLSRRAEVCRSSTLGLRLAMPPWIGTPGLHAASRALSQLARDNVVCAWRAPRHSSHDTLAAVVDVPAGV